MNFRAVLECDGYIFFTVNGHEVHQRPPQTFVKCRHHRILRLDRLDKGIQLVGLGSPFLYPLLCRIVLDLGSIVAVDQFIIAFLVVRLVLNNAGIFIDAKK